MTFRELLSSANIKKTFRCLFKRYNSFYATSDRISLSSVTDIYTKVIKELLLCEKTKPYPMSIVVSLTKDIVDDSEYCWVSLLNPKYVDPPKGALPWGGKNPPSGYYNCNLNKYNKWFATDMVKWSKLIDTPIINQTKISDEEVLAEILYEITFYGFTQLEVDKKRNELVAMLNSRMKSVKKSKNTLL